MIALPSCPAHVVAGRIPFEGRFRLRLAPQSVGDDDPTDLLDLVCLRLPVAELEVENLRHAVAGEYMVVAADVLGEAQVGEQARRSSNRMFASELPRRIPSKVFETLLSEEPPALKASSGTPNDSVEQAESTRTRSDRPEVADLQDQERGRSELHHGVLGPTGTRQGVH